MSRAKKITFALLLVLIVLQFIRPANNSSSAVPQGDMITQFNVPSDIAGILKTSCYDCHSNNTRYPWYVNIQPAGWLLAKHIKDGKEDLNFNEFASYSQRRQLSKLKSIQNSIKDNSMPIASYTWIHGDAKLSSQDKGIIIDWTSKILDSLSRNRQ